MHKGRKEGSTKSVYIETSYVVQVTPKGAYLLEFDPSSASYELVSAWETKNLAGNIGRKEIVTASINPSQVLLALDGGWMVALYINQSKAELQVFV